MKKLTLMFLWISLSACVPKGVVEKTATLNSNDESIFIIGVAPENFHILVFSGEIINGVFVVNRWRNARLWGAADKGFMVGKASAGETLAITKVHATEKGALMGNVFKACNGAKTMTFQVPGGKAIYLGHVAYEFAGNTLRVDYHKDLASAQKYMDDNYPGFQGKVEQWEYDLNPTTEPCLTTLYIPIYLPR